MNSAKVRKGPDVKFLLCVLSALAVLATGLHFLHAFQVKRTMSGLLLWHADAAEERGQYADLARYLNGYLDYMPGDTAALARYGLALSKLSTSPKERLQAFLVLEQVLRREPHRHEVRKQLANIAIALDRFADAREHLELLLREATPDDGKLEHLVGKCYIGSRDYAKAAEWFGKAITHGPHDIESYVRLADLSRRRLNLADQADDVMNKLVANNERSVQAYLARGLYWKEIGLITKANQDISRAAELGGDAPEVLIAMAALAQEGKDPDKARVYLEHGIKLYPQNAHLYEALAGLGVESGRLDEAIACLRRGLRVIPNREGKTLLWSLANLMIEKGEDAGRILDKLERSGIPEGQLDYLRARILTTKHQWLKASKVLERIRPELAGWRELCKQAEFLLGRCYEQIGDYDLGYAAYRRAATLDPLWQPGCLAMCSTLVAMGRNEDAIVAYRKLIPKVPRVRIEVARLLILRNLKLAPAQQQWDEVDQLLGEAERTDSGLINIPILRAEALAVRGEYQRSYDLLEGALRARLKEPQLWLAKADLAQRQGKFETALAVLDDAVRQLGDRVEFRLARAELWARHGGSGARDALGSVCKGLENFSDVDRLVLLRGLANAHARSGDLAKAEELWMELAQQQPNDLDIKLKLFDLALQTDNDRLMVQTIDGIKDQEGSEGTLWRYGRLCYLIWTARQGSTQPLEEAGSLLSDIAAQRPAWARLPVCQAEMCELRADQSGAIRNYQRAIELGEGDPHVIRRLVQLLYEHRRYIEADQVLQKLSDRDQISSDLQRLSAEISLRTRDYGRALELARKAVSAQSKDYRDYIWLGQVLWFADRRADAEPVLRRAVELADDVPDTWVSLVQYLIHTGQQDQAEDTIHQARKKLSPEEAPLAVAQCYEALGRIEHAKEFYRDALSAKPDDVATLRSVASFYLRLGQPKEAEPHLQRIIALKRKGPEDAAWARRILAIVLATTGDYRQSRQALTVLDILDEEGGYRTSGLESAEDLRAKAVVLAAQKSHRQRREAIQILEDLVARQLSNADDQFLLAQLYDLQGNWPRARQQMLSLLTAEPEKPVYIAHYVHSLVRHGDLNEAQLWLAKVERFTEMAGTDVLAELKVRQLAAHGKTKEAIDLLESYVTSNESKPATLSARLRFAATLLDVLSRTFSKETSYANAAEALYRQYVSQEPDKELLLISYLSRQGRLEEILDRCERASNRGTSEELGNAIITALQAAQPTVQQYRRAEVWLEKAMSQQPGAIGMHLCLAYLRDMQGRHDDAAGLYRQIIQRDPRNAIALNNLASLLALNENKPAEALDLLKRAMDLAGPLPELLDTRAVIYLTTGQTDLAIKDLEELIQEAPLAPSYFHLAQALSKAKKQKEARSWFQKAMAAGLKPGDLHSLERPTYRAMLAELGHQ